MRAFLALCLSVLLVPIFLCGMSALLERPARYTLTGSFHINPYTIQGPGGNYGFFSYGSYEDDKRMVELFGYGSAMCIAGKTYNLAMPLRTALLSACAFVNIVSGAIIVSQHVRQNARSNHEEPAA